MLFFRSRSSSLALAASDLKGKIQDVRARFITAKDELVDLPIPKMKETLLKIEDLLDLCKKSKGEQAPVNNVVNLLSRLLNDVLEPVSNQKIHGEVKITEALLENFRALFEELYDVIPIKPSSSSHRMFRILDVGAVVTPVIPRMDAALQTFLSTGSIQCTSEQSQGGRIQVLDVTQTAQIDAEEPADVSLEVQLL
ncbi:hypothetical protein FRC02_006860 [Tulasnella sp. 418]|nr:hypothetical protein FRC02_006860 [Tulasnella sp. 418]